MSEYFIFTMAKLKKRKIKKAKRKNVKRKAVSINKEKILKELKKELYKNTYQHRFGHYCFECELHPDDSPEELEKQMQDLHLN